VQRDIKFSFRFSQNSVILLGYEKNLKQFGKTSRFFRQFCMKLKSNVTNGCQFKLNTRIIDFLMSSLIVKFFIWLACLNALISLDVRPTMCLCMRGVAGWLCRYIAFAIPKNNVIVNHMPLHRGSCWVITQAYRIYYSEQPVLWIRIRMDPELFVGSGTRGFGSGSGSESKTGWKKHKNYQKMN
jgi:hypothetical protein